VIIDPPQIEWTYKIYGQKVSDKYGGLLHEMIDMQNNMFEICAKLIIDFVKMEATE